MLNQNGFPIIFRDALNFQSTPVMILHDRGINMLLIHLVDRQNFQFDTKFEIVAIVDWAELFPYVNFMSDEAKIEIFAEVVELIARVSHNALMEKTGVSRLIPKDVCDSYISTMKKFRRYFYDAEDFVKTLRQWIIMLWKRAVTYREFHEHFNSKLIFS